MALTYPVWQATIIQYGLLPETHHETWSAHGRKSSAAKSP